MHALCVSGLFSFERLFGKADRLFFPNLNIVGRPRLPYTLLVHDLSFFIQPRWFTPKTRAWHAFARPRALISEAETLFVVSEWSKLDLVQLLGVPMRRIQRIPVPLPVERGKKEPSLRPIPEPYFFLLSAADERKNASVARLAFQAFRDTHPRHRLVLAGTTERINEPGVRSLGYLPEHERRRWLEHAQALLYPSWYEGFGLPPHEATAVGIPTIASGSGVLAETCPPGTVLLPPHLPSAWQGALERFA